MPLRPPDPPLVDGDIALRAVREAEANALRVRHDCVIYSLVPSDLEEGAGEQTSG